MKQNNSIFIHIICIKIEDRLEIILITLPTILNAEERITVYVVSCLRCRHYTDIYRRNVDCLSNFPTILLEESHVLKHIILHNKRTMLASFMIVWLHKETMAFAWTYRPTGPVWFRGAEVSCRNILSIACPKIKWFCPNMT